MSKTILTQSILQKHFTYHSDGYLIRIKSTNKVKVGSRFSYLSADGYIRAFLLGNDTYEHRLIFLYHNGFSPKEIDHINRIKTDNRIENLRPATKKENSYNRTKFKNNKSSYKGVSFNKKANKYVAQITVNNSQKYLGLFDDPKNAHKAYCEAALKYHAEFACTE